MGWMLFFMLVALMYNPRLVSFHLAGKSGTLPDTIARGVAGTIFILLSSFMIIGLIAS